MSPFATPDFGASACLSVCLLIAWTAVFLLVLVGMRWGVAILRRQPPRGRKWGVLLIVASGLVPLCCALGPPHVVWLLSGSYPLGHRPHNKIQEGMSEEEVAAILGPPHDRVKRGDGERWYYWIDSFGLSWYCVRFGPEGRVLGTHGN
jgi:hypothetical protein